MYVLDPDSLTVRTGIRTASTVVCTVLLVLRGLREATNGVTCIPDLVDTAIAVPNLSLNRINVLGGLIPGRKTTGAYGSAIYFISTSKINTLVAIDPNHTVIALRLFEMVYCALKVETYCIIKLLVGIFRSTRPYLKFCAVCVVATCYVQAFASKCLNSSPCEEPLLSGGIYAGLYSDRGSIGVRRSCQAFG